MARRGHGEGSVSKRRDGRWEAKLSLGYRQGKRLRKAFYGPTRADVQRQLREAQKARDDGLPLSSDDRMTVETYLERWYAATEPNVRPKTRRHFRWCMTHLIDGLGHHSLKQLQPHDVQIWLNRKARTMSPQSVHHFRATLRLSLNQAMRWGILGRNVATLVDVPEMERPEIHPLTAEQARVLVEHWRDDPLGPLYATALLLGLRQGEALGLKWSDVDLERAQVRVTKTALGRTKTKASIRTVSMPPTLVAILREYRDTSPRSLRGWVFPSHRDTPLDGTNVTHRFQRFLAVVGLPRITFHTLRHTTATLMLERGIHPKIAADYLGHSTIALFMQTYAHVTQRLSDSAAAEIEAAVSG